MRFALFKEVVRARKSGKKRRLNPTMDDSSEESDGDSDAGVSTTNDRLQTTIASELDTSVNNIQLNDAPMEPSTGQNQQNDLMLSHESAADENSGGAALSADRCVSITFLPIIFESETFIALRSSVNSWQVYSAHRLINMRTS